MIFRSSAYSAVIFVGLSSVFWEVCGCLRDESNKRGSGAPPPSNEPIILWWTPFTGVEDGESRKCDLGSCFFTENREYLQDERTKTVMFYGSDFSIDDLPIPRQNHHW